MKKVICSAENISKSFGKYKALDDVSIELYEGEVFGLLGSNGAGKSTLTKIMSGLIKPEKGEVKFFQYELNKHYEKIKKTFSVVPQEVSCYHGFSVKDNIKFFGLMHGIRGENLKEKTEYLMDWLSLIKFQNKPVQELSGGYKRLTNIACSLIHDPQIIFMDEPTVGLDPGLRRLFWEKIKELKEMGKTICLTTHYLDEAQVLCDRVGLLMNGRLLVKGNPPALIEKFGGYRIVIIKLSTPVSEEHLEAIRRSFVDSQVESIGNTIVISFTQPHSLQKISLLTQWLIEQHYEVTGSVVKEPELEDVFINITGDMIRG